MQSIHGHARSRKAPPRLLLAALLGAVAVITATAAGSAAVTAHAGSVCREEEVAGRAAGSIVPPCPPAKLGLVETLDDGRDGAKRGIAPGNIDSLPPDDGHDGGKKGISPGNVYSLPLDPAHEGSKPGTSSGSGL